MLQADRGNCILIVAIPQRQLIYGRSAEMAVFGLSSPVGEGAAALEICIDIESNMTCWSDDGLDSSGRDGEGSPLPAGER